MSRVRLTIILFACIAAGVSPKGLADEATKASPPAPRCFALLVGGAPGTAMNARHYANWLGRFQAQLKASVSSPEDLMILTPQQEVAGRTGEATGPVILDAISNLVARVTPQDQFVLVLIGHGQTDGSLAIPGPDLAPAVIAEALKPMAAKRQIVLGFSACSGAMIPELVKPGRIIIASHAAGQTSDTEFAEFFLMALEAPRPVNAAEPAGAAPQPASLLEIFNTASYEYAQWVVRQQLAGEGAGQGWIVQGGKAREIYRRLYGEDDVPESKRMSSTNKEGEEDVVLPLSPGVNPDVAFWSGRRLPNGTPSLEDTGKSDGVSSLTADKHEPITGSKGGGIGMVAKRTILGRPEGYAK
ncbi:MAG: C13 family peptidase [FCB group bacterium]|jgi:hypothetical protein|nr:C13 family peptidase [FCB group bacterium]